MSRTALIHNIKSGSFLALLGLPMCLGISIASSCPPVAGIITSIVGGLVSSLFGGCRLAIKGPPAGLIVIIISIVSELGEGDLALGFKRMLAVSVVAAALQIILALMGAARLGKLMPPAVLHGMLAAIGVIIVSKQIHILMGASPQGKNTLELIGEIPNSIINCNPELAFIGIFTFLCMILLPKVPSKIVKAIPPAGVALLVVIPLGLYWQFLIPHTYNFFGHTFVVGPNALVDIPDGFLASLTFPDFSILNDWRAYKHIAILCIVGSVETIMTSIAIDSIGNTRSNLNRDLLGIGVGNLVSGFIGGLPMISEVVRSKANIDGGARDHWPNFFHGGFLLLALAFLSPIIKEIPLAALAAMLMIVAVRLAAPSIFFKTYTIGRDQFLIFLTTMGATLVSGLLVGVIVGILLKILIHILRGMKIKNIIIAPIAIHHEDSNIRLALLGPAVFSNYFSVQKNILDALKTEKSVIFDISEATLVDHTTLNSLHQLIDEVGENRFSLTGIDKLKSSSKHYLSTLS